MAGESRGFQRFSLEGRVAVITGGAGLLGAEHATAVAEAGGVPVLWDIDDQRAEIVSESVRHATGISCKPMRVDVTNPEAVDAAAASVLETVGPVSILINNAARDPKVSGDSHVATHWEPTRLEHLSLESWHADLSIGLTSAFLCSRVLGARMAEAGGGVILNIASDLGIIAPDQRLYRREGTPDDQQPVKPVTYSVVKHGIIGLTRYLATYWAHRGVRCNALAPGGVQTDQPRSFVGAVEKRVPLGRMARVDEYRGAVQFLVSDASSYVNGAVLVADGGRSIW